MAAATAMRSARGGGGARRPFAPVVVSPPPPSRAGNQMAQEEAVLGAGAGGKAAKKCCSGLPPVPVSSKKTPAAAAGRAPSRTASRRRAGSCAKRCSTLGLGAAAAAKAAYDAPRAPVRSHSDQRDDRVRAVHSSPLCKEPGQERRGSEASASRKRRAMMSVAVEEVMAGLPEPGEGRVKYLVNTFEKLLSLAAAGGGPEARGGGARSTRRKNEATATSASAPATPPGAEEIDVSYPSIASSSEASFPAVAGVACILDASDRTSRITRARGQRRQRTYNSTGASEKTWSRKVTRVTSQHPFNLRTEQRGKAKEENFVQRLRKMQLEEERLRNPLAQGLPYTTDEPETPVKPPLKEPTEPIDLVLHSDVRAIGRAKFDHQVAERSSFIEEVKLERERQLKVDEEIEIKQFWKEQVPRAHPMPDFTRPFVPKRSVKPQTIPREPRFHPRLMRHVSKA
ncbi:uncharacterized protein LOC120666568 isoform X2 [Panicum virgatum]|uniref:TPX2 C-terminal domain-containing protein n=1 Tax=Panicum virgatum TaxID=38727 RepID=A0A8T0UKQ1_PANVG|nr:uncharacterized protein LOC120666568 isoform X2 [Panicum virgatum]KAG2621666.1 hypothetical protein PVAP13_3NG311892 [Panicum virgatum]